jgi:hypothetical protein
MTVVAAVAVFVVLEVTSGTLSSKYSFGENLSEQFGLLPSFVFRRAPFPPLVGLILSCDASPAGRALT